MKDHKKKQNEDENDFYSRQSQAGFLFGIKVKYKVLILVSSN